MARGILTARGQTVTIGFGILPRTGAPLVTGEINREPWLVETEANWCEAVYTSSLRTRCGRSLEQPGAF
jgi:hypothetical protein